MTIAGNYYNKITRTQGQEKLGKPGLIDPFNRVHFIKAL
jgi:hypothetical protein